MWDCAHLTTRPTRLDFRAAPHGPFSKRVTKAMGSQQRSLNACCGPLSSRHAPARSWWNTSRKSPSVSMVGAGNNNSDLPFACPTPSQAGPAPMKRIISELQAQIAEKRQITVDSMIKEFAETAAEAKAEKQYGPAM